MEPQFNTSFIPKKSLQADVSGGSSSGKYVGRRDVHGPGFYLMLLFFLASVLSAIAVFGYTTVVQKTVDTKVSTLKNQKQLFSEENIAMLLKAESHINNARSVLNNHVAVTELFKELERITLKRIQYMELLFTATPGLDAVFSVTGFADNFQDVALQTTEYRKSPSMSLPIVRELERLETGPVLFSVDVTADPSLIAYRQSLLRTQGNSATSIQHANTTPPLVEDSTLPTTTETLEQVE